MRGVRRVWHIAGLLTVALALGACNPDSQGVSAQQPRGATVAFDSLTACHRLSSQRLVKNLNDEAQSRRLAVISREQPSAYRVRGYLAATVAKTSDDDFMGVGRFLTRTSTAPCVSAARKPQRSAQRRLDCRRRRHAAADRAIEHGATCCVPDLAGGRARNRAIGGAPNCPHGRKRFLPGGCRHIPYFRPQADPISTASAEPSGEDETGPVPLPRRRPAALVSSHETLTLAASRR